MWTEGIKHQAYHQLRDFCRTHGCLFTACCSRGLESSKRHPQPISRSADTWFTAVWPYANTLFGMLAVIEFAWSAAVMLLEKSDLQSWTAALVRKVMWLGAFYALLLYGRFWIPAIIDSFEMIGQNAAGTGPMSPSDVFTRGIDLAGALMATSSSAAFFTNLGHVADDGGDRHHHRPGLHRNYRTVRRRDGGKLHHRRRRHSSSSVLVALVGPPLTLNATSVSVSQTASRSCSFTS